jgi:outer membrane lipoprotein LolB
MRVWLVCLATLVLAACADIPGASDGGLTLGPPLQRVSAEGRISLRQGERSDHLRFRWEHAPGKDVVLLMSPLGQGMAELTRDASGARLLQPKQPPIAADTLQQLAQKVFSVPLPLEVMAEWLRGARPELEGEVDGWRVTIVETTPYRQHRLLRMMEARRGDVDFKLVVDEWELPDE